MDIFRRIPDRSSHAWSPPEPWTVPASAPRPSPRFCVPGDDSRTPKPVSLPPVPGEAEPRMPGGDSSDPWGFRGPIYGR